MELLEKQLHAFKKHIACSQLADLEAIMYEKCTVNGEDFSENAWESFAVRF